MNIFILNWYPDICAKQHCDKHVVKMIVETAQILSTTHHVCGSLVNKDRLYKKTHVNHPCARWVRESVSNYVWTWCLLSCLCKEYTFRYNKTHKTESLVNLLMQAPFVPAGPITEPAQAMPDKYKDSDPVKAYRDYYIGEKKAFAKWTNRSVPEWFR